MNLGIYLSWSLPNIFITTEENKYVLASIWRWSEDFQIIRGHRVLHCVRHLVHLPQQIEIQIKGQAKGDSCPITRTRQIETAKKWSQQQKSDG